MSTIVTVTYSPCIDKSTSVPALIPDKKLRCASPKFEPGGGGVNVARAIHRLHGHTLAIYPAGGYTGRFLTQLLEAEGVPASPLPIRHHTRENFIVVSEETSMQYRFGMPGQDLNLWQSAKLLDLVDVSEMECCVISGSMPGKTDLSPIKNFLQKVAAAGKKTIIDSSDSLLALALETGVCLVKPNLNELAKHCGVPAGIEHAKRAAKTIVANKQAQYVVVSMGANGALAVSEHVAMHFRPPEVARKSTVGAGDSMVAGIVLKISHGWSFTEAVRYGVAAGTAATMNPGTELCRLEDVEHLFPLVREVRP